MPRVAKADLYVEDEAGVRRYVPAGAEVPPGVVVDEKDTSEFKVARVGDGAARIATEDTHVVDGAGARRFVRAGDQLPPGTTPETGTDEGTETPAADPPTQPDVEATGPAGGNAAPSGRGQRRRG